MTKADVTKIRQEISKEYRTQLTTMGVKKSKADDLCAGLEDGMTNMLVALREAQEVTIED